MRPLTATPPRTVLMPPSTIAVQLHPGGPVEAVTCLVLPGHAIYLDCTCGCHGSHPAVCPHADAAGERLVREGLARRTWPVATGAASQGGPPRYIAT